MERCLKGTVDLTQLLRRYRGAVMGLCGLIILFFHCWVPTLESFPVIGTVEALLKRDGYFCVDVFFFLSGAGLVYAMRREEGAVRFYIRRLQRVYLPFAQIVLLKAVVDGSSLRDTLLRITGAELLTRGIYAQLWFVPAICLLYLLYPALHRLLEASARDVQILAALYALLVLGGMLAGGAVPPDYRGILYRLPTFLAGVLFGRMCLKKPVVCPAGRLIAGAAALAVIFLLCGKASVQTGIWMFTALQLTAFSLLFTLMVAGLCACMERIALCGGMVRLLKACGLFTLELYGLQEFYWQIAGPLEGRLTYLQTNLLVMAVFPLLSWLLVRLNAGLLRGIGAKRTA